MNLKTPAFISFIICCLVFHDGEAQIVRLGVKAGPRISWTKLDDPGHKEIVNVKPVFNYTVGGVAAFKVKDRYFLHTELNYTNKGKKTVGNVDPLLDDQVTNHYLEIPALFSIQFKSTTKSDRQFKWYLGIGPNVSYWLGGNGVIKGSDLYENKINQLKYTIAFGDRPNADRPDKMYVEDANRLQFGINAGGGLLFEPGGNRKVMVDIRYEWGHTQAGSKGDFLIPTDYDDNLKARNMGLTLSLMYLLEFNTNPDIRNRGKSTIKRR